MPNNLKNPEWTAHIICPNCSNHNMMVSLDQRKSFLPRVVLDCVMRTCKHRMAIPVEKFDEKGIGRDGLWNSFKFSKERDVLL